MGKLDRVTDGLGSRSCAGSIDSASIVETMCVLPRMYNSVKVWSLIGRPQPRSLVVNLQIDLRLRFSFQWLSVLPPIPGDQQS